MTKNAAKVEDLAELHSKVARVLNKTLSLFDRLLDGYDENDPDAVMPTVPPALLTVATKFLNENQITCAPEDSVDMTALEARLAGKPVRPRLASVRDVNPIDMNEPIPGAM